MGGLTLSFETREVKRYFPLTIARGTAPPTNSLFAKVSDGVHAGIGEGMRCFGALVDVPSTCMGPLEELFREFGERSIKEIAEEAARREIVGPGRAALDIALWDLKAKQAGMPLYRLLGLPRSTVATSVTIGIEPKEVVLDRVPKILEMTGGKKLKIKLGSPNGEEHDREIFLAAKEASRPFGVSLRVDANGGWDVDRAKSMIPWLKEEGCEYVEQPFAKGNEAWLSEIYEWSPLPIFLDESIFDSSDVVKWASVCHGINLKLMKSGGVTEGLAVLLTAKACGLKTMIGCMSDTSIGIAAGVALSGLCDFIDLDNHTNLDPDPAFGAELVDGVVLPREVPGHGAELRV